jgi:2-polyprenyl-6-methoxyphenol hydroxylase-like FAD-dependent oxidoreductase
MQQQDILIVGGGIGGLTAAIALCGHGHTVTLIERDPQWTVYGVGIIQQGNVLRAMQQLGLYDRFIAASVGFDFVAVHAPDGTMVARVPSPRLVPDAPASVGISRPALQKILADRARELGAHIRLGLTVAELDDDGSGVTVAFSDGSSARHDLVIGADGAYSQTRRTIMPDEPGPQFTGQAVWRYNLPRLPDLDALHVYNGPTGAGLVPISQDLMYLFLTTAEPGNPRYPLAGIAAAMRAKVPPSLAGLAEQITDDAGVVYRPLEGMMVRGDWHKGRVVLLGDAVHATTPHLGQGGGMAVEDALVLAEELARADTPQQAFAAYRNRRIDRCAYIVDASLAICMGQLGKGPPVDNATATADMFHTVAQPI